MRTASTTTGGPAIYEILGATGESVGTVVREPALRNGRIRTRWTVTAAGRETVTGHKGDTGWWIAWWLFFPVQWPWSCSSSRRLSWVEAMATSPHTAPNPMARQHDRRRTAR
ncbi:hypothetical protein [Nocardia spumae]|uniref:hypothetical protein n=1 Tax=Nocardia spumae TaxID=2887190 RepID=UPI001D14C0D1|nr:hypothetical protein [Nocardia spumae]